MISGTQKSRIKLKLIKTFYINIIYIKCAVFTVSSEELRENWK